MIFKPNDVVLNARFVSAAGAAAPPTVDVALLGFHLITRFFIYYN